MSDWLSGGAGVINAGTQLYGTIKSVEAANKAHQLEVENFRFQKDAFSKTWANQLAQQEYAKALQQTMFAREDNAVQRKVADLKAAGLSPILAAGQGAHSGPVVSVPSAKKEAPQRGVQGLLLKQAAYGQLAEVGKTVAETALLTAQARAMTRDTERRDELHPVQLKQAMTDLDLSRGTIEAMIRKAVAEAEQAEEDAEKAKALRQKEWLDLSYKKALVDWLKAKYPGTEVDSILSEKTPEVQDYMLKALALQLMEHDIPMLTSMPFPSGMLNTALSSLTGILR